MTNMKLAKPHFGKARRPATPSPPVQSQSTPGMMLRVFSSQAIPSAMTSAATMIIRRVALIISRSPNQFKLLAPSFIVKPPPPVHSRKFFGPQRLVNLRRIVAARDPPYNRADDLRQALLSRLGI